MIKNEIHYCSVHKFVFIDFLRFETVNSQGKLEYVGRVINNSQEKINQVSLRYIIRDEEDSIVEAVTFPISGAGGDYLSQGEVVIFKFFVRSDPKNIFNKELNLDYN